MEREGKKRIFDLRVGDVFRCEDSNDLSIVLSPPIARYHHEPEERYVSCVLWFLWTDRCAVIDSRTLVDSYVDVL